MNPEITVVGNLGDDPELRYSATGQPFTRMSVAHTDRKKEGDKWVDGDTFWWNVTAFGSLAENVAESLRKGERVIVHGRVEPNEWDDEKSGTHRRSVRLIADDVGPELRWATASVHRVEKRDGGQGGPTERRAEQAGEDWDNAVAKDRSAPEEAPF